MKKPDKNTSTNAHSGAAVEVFFCCVPPVSAVWVKQAAGEGAHNLNMCH